VAIASVTIAIEVSPTRMRLRMEPSPAPLAPPKLCRATQPGFLLTRMGAICSSKANLARFG
jgi:hypothetical protein